MSTERKKLCIAVLCNFLIGIIIGVILYYGQLRSTNQMMINEYTYDKTVETIDFFKVAWLNMLWSFAIFITHNILPSSYIYPIILIRGCASSFCVMYMLEFIGIKEVVASVLPQCFSILPYLMLFSIALVQKRRNANIYQGQTLSLRRSEIIMIFLFSIFMAGIETLLFRFFCICLF